MATLQFFDTEVESQLVACALIGEAPAIEANCFHDLRLRKVWAAISDLRARGDPVSPETVLYALGDASLETQSLVTDLMLSLHTSLLAPVYAERVVDLARRRAVLEALQDAAKHLQSDDLETVVGDLHIATASALPAYKTASQADVGDVLEEFILRHAEPVDTWGLRTGFPQIDHELGGLHLGEVFLIAGDPGVGKSILAGQLAYQMAGVEFWPGQMVSKVPGAVYELEMSCRAVKRRVICGKSRVEYRKIRTGRVSPEERDCFLEAADVINAAPVFMSDATDWTTSTLRADLVRLMREKGVRWAIIDYAGLLKDKAGSEIEREMQVSRSLHDIAKMGLALLVVETMNKEGLKGSRGHAGVRGSVQKVYDADVIALLQVPPEDHSPTPVSRELKFTKAREADCYFRVPLILRGAQKRFDPAEQRSEPRGYGPNHG